MTYTKHAIERLKERYNLEPSEELTALIDTPGAYKVIEVDIVGTEKREVFIKNLFLKYVVRDNQVITFLKITQPEDSFFKLFLELRDDFNRQSKEVISYRNVISTKDKEITKLKKDLEAQSKEYNELKYYSDELKRELSSTKYNLTASNKYVKALKKKVEDLRVAKDIVIVEPEVVMATNYKPLKTRINDFIVDLFYSN